MKRYILLIMAILAWTVPMMVILSKLALSVIVVTVMISMMNHGVDLAVSATTIDLNMQTSPLKKKRNNYALDCWCIYYILVYTFSLCLTR